ncbi:MAG: carbamoyltransferase [Myxococcota bacterium]
MTAILGISAFYHDSAAALVVDGRIVAAAQEERFTRKKHDHEFPTNAIDYCLKEAGLQRKDLDYVGFYDKPLKKFDRLLETYVAYAPAGFRSFLRAMPVWMRQKLHLPREMRKALGGEYKKRFVFPEHHESHAASAFFPSPFDEAAVLTLDGVGEWATASFGVGKGNKIDLTHELRFPHSLGLLYSAFTYYCGFKVNSGEYKLMGLAPYGDPKYVDKILDNLMDLKEDGSFRMDMSCFNYCQGLTMVNSKFEEIFGRPARTPESELDQWHMDVAASIQKVCEEVMLRMCRHVKSVTKMDNLCLAGGVALNCVGNGRVLREGPFENVWIQPAAGDAGGALGTALLIWHQLLGNDRVAVKPDGQSASMLGPHFDNDAVAEFLDSAGATFDKYDDEGDMIDAVAELLANENVVGWMQGRMEFGPRALGHRSIIGDPRSEKMQSTMNLKIKFRESFRPFAPSVLQDRVDEYFDMRKNEDSPYMLLVAPVKEERRNALTEEQKKLFGIEKLNIKRSDLPAITHVDYSARVQTIDPDRHDRYYKLIKKFDEKTGCPVIINTSFNVRGEPIVCSPEHAYRCFMSTHMDVLVMENYVLKKTEQPEANLADHEKYLQEFALD